ncbi:MAG: carboxypeptidase regulatory-like domain-containing protein [Acidobacteriia bacterium]|nr:carboxypeptidase regulatory-like domain-containing protein [Terriglobia bacterium]
MSRKHVSHFVRSAVAIGLAAILLPASEHHGMVKFGGLPVPGATVTVTQNGKTLTAVTDPNGAYAFPDLADGTWSLQIEMPGFATITREVGVAREAPSPEWEMKMLPLNEIQAVAAPPPAATPAAPQSATAPGANTASASASSKKYAKPKKGVPIGPTNTQTAFQRADLNAAPGAAAPPASEAAAPAGDAASSSSPELTQRAADGLLINGTNNNGNSSPFALAPRFGNNVRGRPSLYNGNLGVIFDNSSLDARPYSLTGQNTDRPSYNHFQGVAAFGGPLKIPWLVPRNGPTIFVNYQWMRNRNDSVQPGLMPTDAERTGDFSQVLNPLGQPVQIFDPTTHIPFSGNVIPQSQISPQAQALLRFFPEPNFASNGRYNYQIGLVNIVHQDSLQSRVNKAIGRKNQVAGSFAMQSTRSDNPNLFGFLDTNDSLGYNLNANWRHSLTPRLFLNLGYQFSRQSIRINPFFANRENVAGNAQITGNNQQPVNWGPPTLSFANFSALSDGLPSFTRNQTSGVSIDNNWSRSRHNVSFGGDFRRQQFNVLGQQDPRGAFAFTGAAAGYDFAGFFLGVPDTSSIAFGNADKYFRDSIYEAYVTDDWRMSPGFTLNAGVRWEYWSPITEQYGRLVNLDVASRVTAVAPVVANNPTGPLTGQHYPDSLMQPDKHAFQPRIAFSWRPFPASSMVVRGGYGVYYNTSVYQTIAMQMAQQSPLSKSLSVQNSAANPLTLANGFNASPNITTNTFAVDPNFRVGYAQNWQVSVQRDMPGALVLIAMYLGSKGTRGMQEFLPNTFPAGAANPCPTCPSGFTYLASNGNSTRHAGQISLRRRLHNGFTANLQYTFAKAIDDSALGGRASGGSLIAQNWLDLGAERGLSNFDQRHQITAQIQYTSGMGIGGGTLLSGWKGTLFKQWTVLTNVTAGTGMPLSPSYFAATLGTGITGTIRPDYTGAPLYTAPAGLFLNSAAYAPPASGQWGNAGRNSITGPAQFSFNASLGRIFQLNDRLGLDLRFDAVNAINHVTFQSWNTLVNGAQFGLPQLPNTMRSVQTNVRLRF